MSPCIDPASRVLSLGLICTMLTLEQSTMKKYCLISHGISKRTLAQELFFVFFVFWQVLSFFLVCIVFWRSGRHPDVGPQLESHRWGVKIQGVREMPPWLINVPGKCSTITPVCNLGDEQQTALEQKKEPESAPHGPPTSEVTGIMITVSPCRATCAALMVFLDDIMDTIMMSQWSWPLIHLILHCAVCLETFDFCTVSLCHRVPGGAE